MLFKVVLNPTMPKTAGAIDGIRVSPAEDKMYEFTAFLVFVEGFFLTDRHQNL